jgi:hypothetical protein
LRIAGLSSTPRLPNNIVFHYIAVPNVIKVDPFLCPLGTESFAGIDTKTAPVCSGDLSP